MASVFTIEAKLRDPAKNKGTGSRVSRRLRAAGQVPAIIYGHKLTPQPISVSHHDAMEIFKRSAHLATLNVEGKPETVLIRDVQWDHFGKMILHLDFSRVDAGESIHTNVRLEVRGVAPGVAEGGIVEQVLHDVHVSCRADAIPESIRVDLTHLHLNQSILAKDLKLPDGVTLISDPDSLVLHVVSRAATAEAVAGEEKVAEPELIKRPEKPKED